jgi:DNA-binding winged helix-turn-helix (wHTH) protein
MSVSFGRFTLDRDRRQLLQGSEARHLSPKGFELLSLLIDSRPRALSKAELHERLWPSVFVSDSTLSSLVAEVRAALGENAQSSGFLRTVHRYGYAFNGDATDSEARTAPAALARNMDNWRSAKANTCSGATPTSRSGSSRRPFRGTTPASA